MITITPLALSKIEAAFAENNHDPESVYMRVSAKSACCRPAYALEFDRGIAESDEQLRFDLPSGRRLTVIVSRTHLNAELAKQTHLPCLSKQK